MSIRVGLEGVRNTTLVTSVALVTVVILLGVSLQESFWFNSVLQYSDFIDSTSIVFDNLSNLSNSLFLFSENFLFLFFLTPLSIYIFIKSDLKKLTNARLQKIISYGVLALLASTVLITPYGISYSYWQSAFADPDDSPTNSTEDLLPSDPTQTDDESTVEPITSSCDNLTNSTEDLLPSDPTQTDDESTVEPITSSCDNLTNSTEYNCIEKLTITDDVQISINNNLISSIVYSIISNSIEKLTITDNVQVIINSTTTDIVTIYEESQLIPDEIESWNLLDEHNSNIEFSGNVTISETIQNTTSLVLDGENDYAQMSVNSTDHVTQMTLSTWVKPDYSKGSPEFTILSKEKSFELSINNNISPEKIVKFSVFDGIKWNTVESYQTIPEDWTHITVSYDNDQIKIYVNGELDNSKNIHGLSYIVINDYLDLSTIGAITSESDVIIGAYVETKHGSSTLSKQFSGEIIDIQFFKEVLDEIQVSALYVSSIDEIVYEVTNDEVLLEHEPIEIGKPVIWNQEIRLISETNSVSVELPEDATILNIQTIDEITEISTNLDLSNVDEISNPAIDSALVSLDDEIVQE